MSRRASEAARAAEVRRRLEATFAELDRALIGAGSRAGGRALSISPWSPLDVAEHVTLANRYLLKLVEKCARKSAAKFARGEEPEGSAGDLGRLERTARREFRWDAPEHMLPTGTVTLESVRATLDRQRQQALAVLDTLPAGRFHTIRMRLLGPDVRLDAHEFLALVSLHAVRHAAQIQRVLAELNRRDG